jgi:hypothetical protein
LACGRCFRASLSCTRFIAGTGKKRLTARCRWHFGGGPSYCDGCAASGLLCAEGKANEKGEICPYHQHEPQTLEGWQAWDLTLKTSSQLRMINTTVIGVDFQAYLKMSETLGYGCVATAELLPACDAGVTAALNEKISDELKNR